MFRFTGNEKAIAAAIGAGLTAAISFYPHAGWIPIATAVCTMLATYHIGNTPPDTTPAATTETNESSVRPTVYYGGSLPATGVQATDVVSAYPVMVGEKDLPTFDERTRA